jgi:abc transporter, permease protein
LNSEKSVRSAPKSVKTQRRQDRRFQIISIVFLAIVAFFQTFPFWIKLIDATHSPEFLPEIGKVYIWFADFTLVNFKTVIESARLFQALGVSLLHTVSFTGLSLFVAVLVGYVLAKMQFKGKAFVSTLLLTTLMIPGEILLAANYKLTIFFGINDSILGIILPGIVNVFGIFLVKQYMSNIPDSVLEAAGIDGCGEFKKIIVIVFPMSVPIIMTYVILTFIGTWNEYLFPMILYTTSGSGWLYTLQLAMQSFYPNFGGNADTYVRSAGMILITVPIIIMYLIFQKYILNQSNIAGLK